jgi:hypothetical protein
MPAQRHLPWLRSDAKGSLVRMETAPYQAAGARTAAHEQLDIGMRARGWAWWGVYRAGLKKAQCEPVCPNCSRDATVRVSLRMGVCPWTCSCCALDADTLVPYMDAHNYLDVA